MSHRFQKIEKIRIVIYGFLLLVSPCGHSSLSSSYLPRIIAFYCFKNCAFIPYPPSNVKRISSSVKEGHHMTWKTAEESYLDEGSEFNALVVNVAYMGSGCATHQQRQAKKGIKPSGSLHGRCSAWL